MCSGANHWFHRQFCGGKSTVGCSPWRCCRLSWRRQFCAISFWHGVASHGMVTIDFWHLIASREIMRHHEFLPSLVFDTSLSAMHWCYTWFWRRWMCSVSTALFTPEAPDVSAEKGSDKEIMHSSVSIGIRRFNLKFNHRPKAIRLDQQYVFLLSALFYPVFFSFLRF